MSLFDFGNKNNNNTPKAVPPPPPPPPPVSRFKFRDLKTYNSEEWLANSEKKYRQVFDESEVGYVYAELSCYNKLFDEDDWKFKYQLRLLDKANTVIATFNEEMPIPKTQNIFFIHKAWGNATLGAFWKKGEYRWEAWADNQLIGSRPFYIVKKGRVTEASNPYFAVQSVRFYEGGFNPPVEKDRKYLIQFHAAATRYLWVEFNIKNLVKDEDYWPCELIFNYFVDSGELKGQSRRLQIVYPQDDTVKITAGWGSEHSGSWFADNYRLEVVFMDQLIAVIPFSFANAEIASPDNLYKSGAPLQHAAAGVAPQKEPSLEDVMADLNKLTGLESIKTQIHDYANYLNFIKLRAEKGFQESQSLSLHSVFTGNPGTGKTTVALMLGKIYKKLGLLSQGHVHEVDRADLIGEFIGHTAPKVKEAIKKARGGILFIDEAYSLYRKSISTNDFGLEAIEVLIKEMSDGDGDIAIFVAGYPKEMEEFLSANPGMKSRFNLRYAFPDYTPQEMLEIARHTALKRSVSLNAEAENFLYQKLAEAYRERDRSFGNARFVVSLIDQAKMNMGLRLMSQGSPADLAKEQLSTITLPDVQKIFAGTHGKSADIPVDEDLLKEALGELRGLRGMQSVKTEIDELTKLVRFYRETGRDIRNNFSLHTVFRGNPGTGKTTVARLIAKIYKALGILERGHLVECDRQKLVAGYIGQTAEKTGQIIDQALGGVLFIDEAYALASADLSANDFGREAIETLLKRMEDLRGKFAVIVAGYPRNMNEFLEANPGLKSRFDRVLDFADYNADDLHQIALAILQKENLTPDDKANEHLKNYLASLCKRRDEFFGNAREARKICEEAIKNQHLRMASLPLKDRTPEILRTLTYEDVAEFKILDDPTDKKTKIGFQI